MKRETMLVFALVASLSVLGQSLPMSMSHECQLGPTHWCKDEQTATVCGVLAYCRLHKPALTTRPSPNDMCAECKQYVGMADLLLKNKATQQEIISAMNQACGLLPASVSGVCTEVVTVYGQQAIDMLVNYLSDPAQFCGTIGLCSSETESISLQRLSPSNNLCTECKQYVGTVEMLLKNKATQQEIISSLESACGLLPSSISGVCTQAVTIYGQQAIDMLVNYLADPAQFCGIIRLCTDIKAFSLSKLTPSPNDMCAECKQYVGMADLLLKNKATQQEIISALNQACGLLPASVSGVCSEVVTIYGQQAIDMLVNYLADPAHFCGTIGLCSSETESVSLQRLSPTLNDMCTECKQVLGTVDMLLKNKATQQEVISALNSACGLLPASLSGVCTEVVTMYGQQAIDMLVNYLSDPAQFCGTIGLCADKKAFSLPKLTPSNGMCTECKQCVGTADLLLKNKATQQEIISSLNSACGLLPSSVSGVCTEVVTNYGQQVIDMLVSYLADPAQFCGTIGLCSGEFYALPKFTPSNGVCTECKQVLGTVDMLLKNKATQQEVISALNSACGLLPASLSGVCTQVVTMYGQQAIAMLVNYLADPAQLCGSIGMCSSETEFASLPRLSVRAPAPVRIELYYEGLCPGCRAFIRDQLYPTWTKLGGEDNEIMEIGLYPYGNAREKFDPETQRYLFTCQHGTPECEVNMIETCALHNLRHPTQFMPYIHCVESNGPSLKMAETCAAKLQVAWLPLKTCYDGALGNNLEHKMALKTSALKPAHKYVPWIVADGKHTDDIQEACQSDLIHFVCQEWIARGGKAPAGCPASLMRDYA